MSSDMWRKIFLQLPHAMDMVEETIVTEVVNQITIYDKLEDRFRKGDELHKGEWQDWNPEKFVENIKEEVYDMIIYCAMNLVRKEEARKYGDSRMSYNEAKLKACEEKQTETGDAA